MTTQTSALQTATVEQGAHQIADNIYCTSAAVQRQRLLDFMVRNSSVNTMYARDVLNILAPAARIKELKDLGYNIDKVLMTVHDRDGRPHPRVALYFLVKPGELKT